MRKKYHSEQFTAAHIKVIFAAAKWIAAISYNYCHGGTGEMELRVLKHCEVL